MAADLLLSPNFWHTESVDLFELYPEDLSTSQYSLSPTSPLPPELEFSSRNSFLSAAAAAGTSLNPKEKDSHNAYERNCRRRLNDLYSSLRSLLPHESPQKKKLSIPSTVSRALKYIPELQRRVEQLRRKKEEMLSKAPSNIGVKIGASPAISALCLSDKEIMVQICMVSGGGGGGGAGQVSRVSLCRVLRGLEEEGLQLMNGSSISTHDGRIFHSLHLQARESIEMDGRIFCEHLMIVLKEESRVLSMGTGPLNAECNCDNRSASSTQTTDRQHTNKLCDALDAINGKRPFNYSLWPHLESQFVSLAGSAER